MSEIVYVSSFAIEHLKITTASLDKRVYVLEDKVKEMGSSIGLLSDRLDIHIRLSLLANLITRIQQSMNSGYDILKDITSMFYGWCFNRTLSMYVTVTQDFWSNLSSNALSRYFKV